jgi:hypothetical protein
MTPRLMRPHATPLAVALLLGAASAGPLHAQASTTDSEVYVQQAVPGVTVSLTPLTRAEVVGEVYDRLGPADRAFVDGALGRTDGNAALVSQTGTENTAQVDQAGAGNLAVLVQTGTANASMVEQIGTDNVFGAWVDGDANQIDVMQDGDDNVYLLQFRGDRLDHTVVQEGDRLQLVQTGEAAAPFSVEQRGSDAALIIRHNQGD